MSRFDKPTEQEDDKEMYYVCVACWVPIVSSGMCKSCSLEYGKEQEKKKEGK